LPEKVIDEAVPRIVSVRTVRRRLVIQPTITYEDLTITSSTDDLTIISSTDDLRVISAADDLRVITSGSLRAHAPPPARINAIIIPFDKLACELDH
jgi:hypothetical protein